MIKDLETIIEVSPFDTKIVTENGEEKEVSVLIPQCCREGWASCKHCVQRQSKKKVNIGL